MNKFINESKKKFTLDTTLVVMLLTMGVLSIMTIFLARPMIGTSTSNGLIQKQLMWYTIGIGVIYFLLKIGIDRLFTLVDFFYWFLMAALFLLALQALGVINFSIMAEVNGTSAWFHIPLAGSFQPSEFMKIILVIKFANILVEHNKEKVSSSFSSDISLILKIAKWALPPLILIVVQPDTGIPIIILVSLAIMFFISGVRREWFYIIIPLAIGALLAIVFLYYNNQDLLIKLLGGSDGESYRLIRFYGWLDYEKFPRDHGFQLYNSLLSIGTAGWTGHPLMSLVAGFPEPQTDFIFAVFAQNFGFLGASALIILIFAIDIKLILITMKSNLQREQYFMMGIIGMIVFQDFQNIAMIMGLLPITGITLPFLSYGGSSLISYMIPIAVVLYMHSETQNMHSHSL